MSIIVQSVKIHEHAADDLRALALTDRQAVATILVFLQELKNAPQNAIDLLTTRGNNEFKDFKFNVDDWKSAAKFGNLWRLRILETPATVYRVIYGYNWKAKQLCVLAIVKKDEYDYDDLKTLINQRIITDWNSL